MRGSFDPTLRPGDLHVWQVGLRRFQEDPEAAEILDRDELERARRFAFADDARRFVQRRTALRHLAALYTGRDARELRFGRTAAGKPFLLDQSSSGAISFSVTHSKDLALLAFCIDVAVGIDVEAIRPLDDMRAIADACFSEGERSALDALPENERLIAFFNGWTRKEALLKAVGGGFTLAPKDSEVTVSPQEAVRVKSVAGKTAPAKKWSLMMPQAADGYSAAVAIEHPNPRLSYWQYSGEEARLYSAESTCLCA